MRVRDRHRSVARVHDFGRGRLWCSLRVCQLGCGYGGCEALTVVESPGAVVLIVLRTISVVVCFDRGSALIFVRDCETLLTRTGMDPRVSTTAEVGPRGSHLVALIERQEGTSTCAL
jgi:hypothetical protein